MMAHYYLDVNTTAFTPRDFQVELLAAIKEKNVILCLGHNYSKEFIALKAIQEHAHELRKKPLHAKTNLKHIKKNTLYVTNGFKSTSSDIGGGGGGKSIYNSIHYLTDLSVININNKNVSSIEWDTLFQTYNVIILNVELCVYALQYGHINFVNINLMIIEDCHIKKCITDELANVFRAYEKCTTMKPRLLGLAGPLYSAEGPASRLTAEVEQLEKIVKCKVETASDIVTLLRYSLKPIEIILQCEPANETELTQLLHEQILILKHFMGDHRFDPSETYGSFKEEINKMSDPKLEPLKLIDEYLMALNDLGAWGADRLAFNLIKRIEKLKIKTAYERHFLLLCLTETTFVQIRAICERKFEKLANDKERIEKYSSPKILRIIEILRLFKVNPVDGSNKMNPDVKDDNDQINEINSIVPSETVNSVNIEKKKSSKSLQKVNELLAQKKSSSKPPVPATSVSPTAALHLQFALKPFNRKHGTRYNRTTGRAFSMNRYRNINNIDPDALYGIIFCNKDTIAKLLHNLIHTMSKCDKDLSYVCAQYTTERTANPLTEPKEAETEHRKQEDVLKRFRMHECNLLIGTTILEEGIDLPKCNLVIRWDPPTTYRSYVQCKGRARATNAFHIIMVTSIINDQSPPSISNVKNGDRDVHDNHDDDDDENGGGNQQNAHLSAQSHKLICSESYKLLVGDECLTVNNEQSAKTSPDNVHDISGDDDDEDGNDLDEIIEKKKNKKLKQDQCNLSVPTLKHDPMVSNLMEKYVCVEKNKNGDDDEKSSNNNNRNTKYLKNLLNMENCTKQMVEKTAHYKEIEKMLIKKCDNAEPLQKEFILSDKYTVCLEPYKPLSNPSGPSVNLSTAIALINKYCAKLPSDTFTKLIPSWRCAKTTRFNKKWYQYTIRLPINSPLKQDILGLPMPTRILARRCAALIACRILHQSGELDDSLQPITKEGFRASEPDWDYFELDPHDEQMVSDNSEARPGTTKRRQYYYKKIAAVLSNCRPTANRFAYFYLIKLKLECPIPEEQNTRGRKVYPPEEDAQGFGILTLKEIPKLSAFPIFTRSGEVRVSIELSKERIFLSDVDIQQINTFINYTFSKVLRLKKYFMVYDKDATENSFYIVPTIKRQTKKEIKQIIEIDWDFLASISKTADDLPTEVSEEERSKNQFEMNKFTDAVVMPWYRNQDQPQYFYVAEICNYLTPDSTFPGENYTTFKEYYYLKYNIKIQNAQQPLLDVDHTSARLNFLTPRYVNRKGVALPTSSEETKRAKRENLEQKQILVPELCTIHPFPASLWRAAVCLPCILYRINALLLADEIRIQVANEMGLGKAEINDSDFKWPLLDFGWTLAEVLKKSREARLIRQQQQQQQQQNEQNSSIKSSDNIKYKNNTEMIDSMNKINKDKDKESIKESPIAEQLNGKCDGLMIKTANDILDEADKKLKNDSVLEIGMWSNDMINDINDYDDCEWGLLPPNIKMCSTDKTNIRYGSPTSWDVDNRTVSPNYNNHIVIDKNTIYYSDSDRSYDSDDDDFDTKSTDSNESNTNKYKIQFKSDNIAEAIETEEDIMKQKRQIEIINNINAIKSNTESNKNCVCGFMGFIDNNTDDVDDCKRIKQHEYHFKKSIANFQNYIYNSGMLIKHNQMLNIKDGKRIMETASNPMNDFIKFGKYHRLIKVVDENGEEEAIDDLDSNCDSVNDDAVDDVVVGDGDDDEEDDHYDCDHSEDFKYLDNISNLDKFYDLVSFIDPKIFNEYIKSKTVYTIDDLYALNRIYFERQQQQQQQQEKSQKTSEIYEIEGTGDLFDNFNDYHNIKMDTINNRKELTIDNSEFFKERIINHSKDDIMLFNDDNAVQSSTVNSEGNLINGFSFDYQPNLIDHYGPCPSVILQGLTMSNANDGINLERLETIGDSFLKYAITTYLYCKYDNVHEGKLSHLRSKQVSNLNLYRLGRRKMLGESMIATKFEPHDNWLPPCYYVPKDLEKRLHESKIPACHWNLSGLTNIKELTTDEIYDLIKFIYDNRKQLESENQEKTIDSDDSSMVNGDGYACFLPYNLVTQHSIPDKSIADCVEALIGSYLIECGPRGALLFMAWLGIRVLPYVEVQVDENSDKNDVRFVGSTIPKEILKNDTQTHSIIEDNHDRASQIINTSAGSDQTTKTKIIYGYWPKPQSPLLLYAPNPYEKLELLLDGYDVFENEIGYKFNDRSYLLQAMTHASYIPNRLTDCYQRLEFLGDAVLDYLITRHLYEDARQHNPGSLTDLRSALVNNTIFASLAVRHGFHKYFRHLSPVLNEVIDRFVRIQHENCHTISEEFYLRSEEECDEAEDIEVPKALGDVFESIAGAIYLDSNKSLDTVWKVYYNLMKLEIELFSNSVPKSPIRELLELEPETAKFSKPEKLADGRRVRVSVEVFGKGTFRGIGRNYRIAKCTAAKCALRQLKKLGLISKKH